MIDRQKYKIVTKGVSRITDRQTVKVKPTKKWSTTGVSPK